LKEIFQSEVQEEVERFNTLLDKEFEVHMLSEEPFTILATRSSTVLKSLQIFGSPNEYEGGIDMSGKRYNLKKVIAVGGDPYGLTQWEDSIDITKHVGRVIERGISYVQKSESLNDGIVLLLNLSPDRFYEYLERVKPSI